MLPYFYTVTPETHRASKSALEIAAEAREHEKLRYLLLAEESASRKPRASAGKGGQEKFLALLKAPLHLMIMAGQWLFMM